eukprot:331392-Chlamydomonas_euryale.AAC.11
MHGLPTVPACLYHVRGESEDKAVQCPLNALKCLLKASRARSLGWHMYTVAASEWGPLPLGGS